MLTAVIVLATIADLSAMFVIRDVKDVPVSRLVTNLERLVREKPTDVMLRVNLARVHMVAYALKASSLDVWSEEEGPVHAPVKENVLPKVRETRDAKAMKEAREHLSKALARYAEAIEIDPHHPFARLGYAWALQQSGETQKAIAAYRAAIETAYPKDIGREMRLEGWQSVTEEAARFLMPLLDPVKDREELARLKERIAKIRAMPRAITPIVIPLRDGLRVEDLVDDNAAVAFDADGSGRRVRWTWLTADAGVLVHDPRGERHITSALQWFGNVTFWLFWDNGYEPLRALDDDGDGRLCARELDGLAIWQDRNGNAISESTEVAPLTVWQIVELSTVYEFADQEAQGIAFSPAGVRFANGSVRPTYDVILHRCK